MNRQIERFRDKNGVKHMRFLDNDGNMVDLAGEEYFAYFNDENGNELPTPYTGRITGHKMLLRRDKVSADRMLVGESDYTKQIDIPGLHCDAQVILDSLEKETHCFTCTVIAVGTGCNSTRNKKDYKMFRMDSRTKTTRHYYKGHVYSIPRHAVNPSRADDRVMIRETSRVGRRWRGIAGREYDLITDEADILAIIPQELIDQVPVYGQELLDAG